MALTPFSLAVSGGQVSLAASKDYEAAFARRAMILMRRLLGVPRITELLKDEIARSDDYWKQKAEASNGNWTPSRIHTSVRGLNTQEFITWFVPRDAKDEPGQEKLAAHPEHWAMFAGEDMASQVVVETLGDKVSRFWLKMGVPVPDFVADLADYTKKMTGYGYTEAGTHMLVSYHQFKDHEDGKGFEADLAVYFPAACEDELVQTHCRHLLVEFRNWFEQAYRELKQD